jgi:hypothetical protein
MKSLLSAVLAGALLFTTAPVSYSEPRPEPLKVAPGTEVRLHIVGTIGTAASRNGDAFVAVLSEPVFVGNTLLIPAGTRVHGTIGTVAPARRFSVFRGQAYMDLNFRSLEIDSRLIPVHMSIIEILRQGTDRDAPRRHDVKIDEGQIVEQRHDYRGDVLGGSISSSGGALIGLIAGNVARGFGFGLIGSAAYIVARKGKEVNLPDGTGMLVSIDDAVTLPGTVTPGTVTPATAPPAGQ